MDETTLTQEPCLCKCWTKQGVQPTIPYPAGSHWNLHCFGGYNIMDNTVVTTIAKERDSVGFIEWLEEVLTHAYPTQRICLILDNASFHYSKSVQAMVALYQERLTLFFLPPYSPELNVIEGYWKYLKRQVHGNFLSNDKAELTARLLQEVANQNQPEYPKRYHLCN